MSKTSLTPHAEPRVRTSYITAHPLILSTAKLLLLGILNFPLLRAAPMNWGPSHSFIMEDTPIPPDNSALWIYLAVALGLVLLGGAFAGLTIALMGQVRSWEIMVDSIF